MAENGDTDNMPLLLWVLGLAAILIGLWFASGGPQRADLRGLFIAPPPPVGPGGSYGPQFGTSTINNP